MKVEELQALARAVQPIPLGPGGWDGSERIVAYNDLVSRFRELVTRALNSLLLRQVVDPELEQELRLLAKALPGARRRAEVPAPREGRGPGEQGAVPTASWPEAGPRSGQRGRQRA
jgi:hypothetical protein